MGGDPDLELGVRRRAALMALLTALVVLPGAAQASDYYVTPTGSDAGSCDSPGSPCATFTYAIGQMTGDPAGQEVQRQAEGRQGLQRQVQAQAKLGPQAAGSAKLSTSHLAPGAHKITLTATSAGGASAPVTVRLTIVANKR